MTEDLPAVRIGDDGVGIALNEEKGRAASQDFACHGVGRDGDDAPYPRVEPTHLVADHQRDVGYVRMSHDGDGSIGDGNR
jgi:hypothetical protein